MRSRARHAGIAARSLLVVLCALGIVSPPPIDTTGAVFSGAHHADASTFGTKAVFSGTRVVVANGAIDASTGTPTDASFVATLADGNFGTTKAFPSSSDGYSTTRYLQVDHTAGLPAKVRVSGVRVDARFRSAKSTTTSCAYVQLLRLSTGASVGSSAEVCWAAGSTGWATISAQFPTVVTSDEANDLMVRIFAHNSAGSGGAIDLDQLAVSGSLVTAVSTPFMLHMWKNNDQSNGTASWGTWSMARPGDGAVGQSAAAAPTAFDSNRYLEHVFPYANQGVVPSDAAVTSVVWQHRWGSSSTAELCYYAVVYTSAGTQLASVGSSSAPAFCRTSTAYAQDTVDLSSVVTTPADLNGLRIRVFWRAGTTGMGPNEDYMALDTTWSTP